MGAAFDRRCARVFAAFGPHGEAPPAGRGRLRVRGAVAAFGRRGAASLSRDFLLLPHW